MAPQQTYLCAGRVYEDEVAGAAAQRLYTEPAAYACQEDPYWYWDYYYYGYDYYSGGDYYGTGGWASGGDGDGDTTTGGDMTSGDVGYGGEAWGGAPGAGGGVVVGAGGFGQQTELLSDWCEELNPNDFVAGTSFAVGSCQLTDLALPIKIKEPSGRYEVLVYGGSSPCERGQLLTKTAGIGTGLTVSIPVDVSGVDFVSVELISEQSWNGLELRLVDRPAVGDSNGGE